MASKRPAIVAELGRPETPQETADRKAASSARYRGSKTLVNLVAAMIATLGIVIVMVVVVMRHDVPEAEPVDVASPAADASAVLGVEAVAPELPESWAANVAELRTGPADITQWYVGYVIDGDRAFASVTQGVDADATWLANVTRDAVPTGSTTIDGVEWTIADQRDRDDVGNLAYVGSATIGASTLVVAGTADDDELRELMTAVTAELAD